MSTSHQNIVLYSGSPYIDLKDPSSQKKLQVGDQIIVCNNRNSAFLRSSLAASENRCPFCRELLSNEKIPYSSSAASQPKKPDIKKGTTPQYQDNRRSFLGPLAALGVGGVIMLVALLVVGALILSAINSGSSGGPTSYDPPASYITEEPATAVSLDEPVAPPEESVQSNSSNSSAPVEQQPKEYATISCAQISFVNLRRTPGYTGKDDSVDSLYEVPCGETVELLGPTKKADGLTWWNVSWNGYTGWIADHTGSGKVILDF